MRGGIGYKGVSREKVEAFLSRNLVWYSIYECYINRKLFCSGRKILIVYLKNFD